MLKRGLMVSGSLVLLGVLQACGSTGEVNMYDGSEKATTRTSTSQIGLFVGEPDQQYYAVADVMGGANKNGMRNAIRAEHKALKSLRSEGAKAGADAIINIRREVIQGGKVVDNQQWDGETNIPEFWPEEGSEWVRGKDYTVEYSGTAVRWGTAPEGN